ncbi:MAG TPA: hypothetical protein VFE41_25700 [Acetobacteraceae bacterium]|nr:hypothetical protein [Acetobacteraceae bacterium]
MAPRDRTTIAFATAQAMVDAIWSDMDLRHPPAVERLPRHATATLASADRLSLCLPAETPAWCLLHEIAHAMSTTDDGRSDGHGPVFMGLYVRLLVRYLRLDEPWLLASLRDAGIRFERDARPPFLDPRPAHLSRE